MRVAASVTLKIILWTVSIGSMVALAVNALLLWSSCREDAWLYNAPPGEGGVAKTYENGGCGYIYEYAATGDGPVVWAAPPNLIPLFVVILVLCCLMAIFWRYRKRANNERTQG